MPPNLHTWPPRRPIHVEDSEEKNVENRYRYQPQQPVYVSEEEERKKGDNYSTVSPTASPDKFHSMPSSMDSAENMSQVMYGLQLIVNLLEENLAHSKVIYRGTKKALRYTEAVERKKRRRNSSRDNGHDRDSLFGDGDEGFDRRISPSSYSGGGNLFFTSTFPKRQITGDSQASSIASVISPSHRISGRFPSQGNESVNRVSSQPMGHVRSTQTCATGQTEYSSQKRGAQSQAEMAESSFQLEPQSPLPSNSSEKAAKKSTVRMDAEDKDPRQARKQANHNGDDRFEGDWMGEHSMTLEERKSIQLQRDQLLHAKTWDADGDGTFSKRVTTASNAPPSMNELTRVLTQHHDSSRQTLVKIWKFLEDKHSSNGAMTYHHVRNALLAFSIVIACIEVLEVKMFDDNDFQIKAITWIQLAVEIWFGVELCLRFATCRNRAAFFLNLYNIIDIISVSPCLLRAMRLSGVPDSLATIAFFGVVPILRVLKVLRDFETFQLLLNAFMTAAGVLPMLIFTMFIIASFFSVMLYYFEPRENISTLPDALYFALITVSTVGYGDLACTTPVGRGISCMLAVIGPMYMAMPIGIIGSTFSRVWEDRKRLLILMHLRRCVENAGYSPKELKHMFLLIDVDGDGTLDYEEFHWWLDVMEVKVTKDFARAVFDSFEANEEGTLEFEDFMKGLFPQTHKHVTRGSSGFSKRLRNAFRRCLHLPKSGVEDEDEEEEEEEITTPSSRNGFQRRRTDESKETAECSAKSKGSDEVARENSQEADGSENSEEARKQPRSIIKSFSRDNGFSPPTIVIDPDDHTSNPRRYSSRENHC
jgi:hypothetical protein